MQQYSGTPGVKSNFRDYPGKSGRVGRSDLGRGMKMMRLLLRVGCDPRVLGMEYCLANSIRVMWLKGCVVGQCM